MHTIIPLKPFKLKHAKQNHGIWKRFFKKNFLPAFSTHNALRRILITQRIPEKAGKGEGRELGVSNRSPRASSCLYLLMHQTRGRHARVVGLDKKEITCIVR